MNLFEFTRPFPAKVSCESYIKAQREKSGIVCKRCGCQKNYWDSRNKCWRCSKCGHETTDIDWDAIVVSDGTKSHINFPKMFSEYTGRKIDPMKSGKNFRGFTSQLATQSCC